MIALAINKPFLKHLQQGTGDNMDHLCLLVDKPSINLKKGDIFEIDEEQPIVVDSYNGDTPAAFVLSKNIFRRNLTSSQKAMVATDILPWYEKENPQGNRKDLTGGNISTSDRNKNRDLVGQTVGDSGRYISDAKKLKDIDPV